MTTDGLPLGLAAVKFWSREKFKGSNALKRKIKPPRVPIAHKESFRWLENLRQTTSLFGAPGRCVHVGDRECDIYELFCLAHDLGTHFIGACRKRSATEKIVSEQHVTIPAQPFRRGRRSGSAGPISLHRTGVHLCR